MHDRVPVLYGALGGVCVSAGVGLIVDALVDLLPMWWLVVGILALVVGALLVIGALFPIGLPGTPTKAERAAAEKVWSHLRESSPPRPPHVTP